MINRLFTPYEQTQLARHGVALPQVSNNDQTPVEYLTGWVTFAGSDFRVDPRVLIPRPETEELVQFGVTHARQLVDWNNPTASAIAPPTPLTIIEVGCGSGAMGISASKQLHQLGIPHQLWLTDVSAEALEVAEQNVAVHLQPLDPALPAATLAHSDILTAASLPLSFDLIMANLPYVPTYRVPLLPPSVRDYEPHLALDGGPTGAELIHALLDQAVGRLSSRGIMWLEIDESHTLATFNRHLHQWHLTLVPDSLGKTRFLRASLRS